MGTWLISLQFNAVNKKEDCMALWQSEYPFGSHYLTIGANRLHYVDEGRGDQPIVCVHGNPTWSFYYRSIVKHFRASQRVVAVDHIGCGLSDKPQKYSYTLAQHIANLQLLWQTLDLRRITLVVHDWGGAIGLGTAIAEPQRVERIVILNTAAFPPPYIPWRIAACRWPLIGPFAVRGLNLFCRAALTMTLHRKKRLSPAVASGLLAPYNNWTNRVAISHFVGDIPTSPNDPTWQVLDNIERNLHQLAHLPVMMIWGMQDWCFRPECLERLHKHLPQAEIIRLDDVGHYVMEDAPEDVLSNMDRFLQAPETAP